MEEMTFKRAVVESVTAQSTTVNGVVSNHWLEVSCRLGAQSTNPLVALAQSSVKLIYSAGVFNADGTINVTAAKQYVEKVAPTLQGCVGQSVELCEFTHDIPTIVDLNGNQKSKLTCYCISEQNTPALNETGRAKAVQNLYKKLLSQGWAEAQTTQQNQVVNAATMLGNLNQVM